MLGSFLSELLKAVVVDLAFKRPIQVQFSRDQSGKFDFKATITPGSNSQHNAMPSQQMMPGVMMMPGMVPGMMPGMMPGMVPGMMQYQPYAAQQQVAVQTNPMLETPNAQDLVQPTFVRR